jgi:hypothetical protein
MRCIYFIRKALPRLKPVLLGILLGRIVNDLRPV